MLVPLSEAVGMGLWGVVVVNWSEGHNPGLIMNSLSFTIGFGFAGLAVGFLSGLVALISRTARIRFLARRKGFPQ
jgi:hypothetical protein